MIDPTTYPPKGPTGVRTLDEIAALIVAAVPDVASVGWTRWAPNMYIGELHVRWWAKVAGRALGTVQKAHVIADRNKPAETSILFRVW